jgi:long-chain acyl-CoA synthetase
MDLAERLRQIVSLDASAEAVQFEGEWWSWGDLRETWCRIDELLGEQGLAEQASVGIVLRNRPEHVASLLALLGTHRCVVSLSPLRADADLSADVRTLPVAAVIASTDDWARSGFRDGVVSNGPVGLTLGPNPGSVGIVTRGTRDAMSRRRPGIAVEMLTSGTTGPPKRIPLPYASLERSLAAVTHYRTATESGTEPRLRHGVGIVSAPLSHISGLWAVVEGAVAGRRLALLERFSTEAWLRLIREHRPRFASLPPTCMRMVLESDASREDLASLAAVRCSTAPADPSLIDAFEARFGVSVLVAYGATEFAGAVAGWTVSDRERFRATKRGSAGRAHPGIELRVADPDTGEVLATGEVGVLQVRGNQLATGNEGGWVTTEDMAHIDQDGFIWIEGRRDDVILRGGFKVGAQRVATAIEKHPAVRAAAVIAVPDERLGQVPVAFFELRPGRHISPDQLLAWVRPDLAAFEVPVRAIMLDELPQTGTLKVNVAALRKLADERTAGA